MVKSIISWFNANIGFPTGSSGSRSAVSKCDTVSFHGMEKRNRPTIDGQRNAFRNRPTQNANDPFMDINWIDEFVRRIKPFIYVRDEDNLLILIPNQAYNLNPSAVAILSFLLGGNPVRRLLQEVGDEPEKRREIHHFFCDLRALVSGCLRDQEKRAAVTYKEFRGDTNRLPVLSEIAVTYRCNLKCEFCYVGRHDSAELGSADIKKLLFKIVREARIPSVSFTGGEPLLRADIVELVRYARQAGLWTNLITNGTMMGQKLVDRLKSAGLSSCQVSIEGPTPDIHDRITGQPGSFDKTVAALARLQAVGIPVHTNTTVSRSNLEHLENIVTLAARLGLPRLSMNLMIPCGSAADRRDLWVSYTEIGPLLLHLKRTADQSRIKFLWYSPVPVCHFNPVAHGFGNKSCAAVTGLLSIDPEGNIIPCSSWREPVGSLLTSSFKSIWHSGILPYFHHAEYAPSACRSCVRFDLCKGACPLYWRAVDGQPGLDAADAVNPVRSGRN